MTATDSRGKNSVLVLPEAETFHQGTSWSDFSNFSSIKDEMPQKPKKSESFHQPSTWNDFSNNNSFANHSSFVKDEMPQYPRRRTMRRNSMIETYSSDNFFASASESGDGMDVFGSNVLSSDPWVDFNSTGKDEFIMDASENNQDEFIMDTVDERNQDFTERTRNLSESYSSSSSSEKQLDTDAARGDPGVEFGTMPLRDHNKKNRSKHSRGRQGRSPTQNSGKNSGPRRPRVLNTEEVASKRRHRSRSRPSFVADCRRGRSLSVPRKAPEKAYSENLHQNSPRSLHVRKTSQMELYIPAKKKSKSKGTKKAKADKAPKASTKCDKAPKAPTKGDKAPKAPKSSRDRSPSKREKSPRAGRRSKSPNPKRDKSPKTRKRSKSPMAARSKSPNPKRDKSPRAGRRSKSPMAQRSKSPNPRARRRSKSPMAQRSKSPNLKRDKSPNPKRDKSPSVRKRSKSPLAQRLKALNPLRRSKSPVARRSKSPNPKRDKSPNPRRRSKSPNPKRDTSGHNSISINITINRRSKSPKARRSKSPKAQRDRSLKSAEKSTKSPKENSQRTRDRPRRSHTEDKATEKSIKKTSSKSKLPTAKKSPIKQSPSDAKKLFAKPLPPKTYLSRGTHKRIQTKVSKDIDRHKINIKSSLANLLSDDEDDDASTGSVKSNPEVTADSSPNTSAPVPPMRKSSDHNPKVKSKRYRRHSIIGGSPSDVTDYSLRGEQEKMLRPWSADSLMDSQHSQKSARKPILRRSSLNHTFST